MAFNFNWSPLIADTVKAKEMLTAALNKSPKPPIIVGDIIVNELNLGTTPPELDILEIGDLAQDRFRGIFKLSYSGDAYLTLKTRVEANPLHTSLSTKPSFTSPRPLAAASGLTIPLQITLSDIRLSGIVILVFCRQKGITLVFRNDPLESLKVSSTFDSIPFVRNYLQNEIEAQLRNLFLEDLPAIIHRLSLRMLVPGQRQADEQESHESSSTPVQSDEDAANVPFTLDPAEMHATFSQKNLLRLAALSESQRTLSLFDLPIRDTIYRAWTGASDRTVPNSARPHHLARLYSAVGSPTDHSINVSEGSDSVSITGQSVRTSKSATASVYSMGTLQGRGHNGRKRKHRVVNLRRHSADTSDVLSVTTDFSNRHSAPDIVSAPVRPVMQKHEGEVDTPPRLSVSGNFSRDKPSTLRFTNDGNSDGRPSTPPTRTIADYPDPDTTPVINRERDEKRPQRPPLTILSGNQTLHANRRQSLGRTLSQLGTPIDSFGGSILDQAWIRNIQADHLRRMQQEKASLSSTTIPNHWSGPDLDSELGPPPAYAL